MRIAGHKRQCIRVLTARRDIRRRRLGSRFSVDQTVTYRPSGPLVSVGGTARSYLARTGEFDRRDVNPDIFGLMIQAARDAGERGELGVNLASVPGIRRS